MKILFIIPEFPPDHGGGIVSFYRDLLPALVRLKCQVDVIKGSAFVHGQTDYIHDGISVRILEAERFEKWNSRFSHLLMLPALRRHLAAAFALHEQAVEGEGYDAVEVVDWGMLFLPWVISSKAQVLVQLHGSTGQIDFHEPRSGGEVEGLVELLLERVVLREAPILSSYSHSNVSWWSQMLGRDVDYTPPPLGVGAEEDYPGTRKGWISFGRIQHWKGPQVACEAWRLLGAEAPRLEWFGRDTAHGETGRSTSAWLKECFPEVWGDSIAPCGQVSPDEVRARMKGAKVVLVPSTWDVFNLVATEAMALGAVVVVSEGAGAAGLIQNGENGFTFPNGDATALAQTVRRVESLSQNELDRIGKAAAKTIREELDPTLVAAARLRLFARPCREGGPDLEWLIGSLLRPAPDEPLAFLNSLPLSALSQYTLRRGIKKVLPLVSRK
jgi:glycosyltransferase involved in cell wall biosynthesis